MFDNSIIGKVYYGQKNSSEILTLFLKKYSWILKKGLDSQIKPLSLTSSIDPILLSHLLSFTPFFKDSSFLEEDEVRLIRAEGLTDPTTGQPRYFDNKYRVFIPFSIPNNIPFVTAIEGNKPAVLLDEFEHSSICEIIIGPACNFIEAKSAIETFLTDSGYNVNQINIEQAKLPIRHI